MNFASEEILVVTECYCSWVKEVLGVEVHLYDLDSLDFVTNVFRHVSEEDEVDVYEALSVPPPQSGDTLLEKQNKVAMVWGQILSFAHEHAPKKEIFKARFQALRSKTKLYLQMVISNLKSSQESYVETQIHRLSGEDTTYSFETAVRCNENPNLRRSVDLRETDRWVTENARLLEELDNANTHALRFETQFRKLQSDNGKIKEEKKLMEKSIGEKRDEEKWFHFSPFPLNNRTHTVYFRNCLEIWSTVLSFGNFTKAAVAVRTPRGESEKSLLNYFAGDVMGRL